MGQTYGVSSEDSQAAKSQATSITWVFLIVNPRMLEEINQWNKLEFKHADWLPALVP